MADHPGIPNWVAIRRGLTGRCARCGGRGIFRTLVDLKDDCPTCGLHFEREEGYWLGAMTVVTGEVLFLFSVLMVVALSMDPDVPLLRLSIVAVVVNGGLPILGYGWAKTTWMGIEQAFNPPSAAEEAAAIARMAVGGDQS